MLHSSPSAPLSINCVTAFVPSCYYGQFRGPVHVSACFCHMLTARKVFLEKHSTQHKSTQFCLYNSPPPFPTHSSLPPESTAVFTVPFPAAHSQTSSVLYLSPNSKASPHFQPLLLGASLCPHSRTAEAKHLAWVLYKQELILSSGGWEAQGA